MTEEETLHDEIDELAAKVTTVISDTSDTLDKYEGVFDPKYRRMNEADLTSMDLF